MVKFLKHWWLLAFIAVVPFERIPSFDVALEGRSITFRLSIMVAAIGIILFGPSILRRLRVNPLSPYFWLAGYTAVMIASLVVSIDKPKSSIVIIATLLMIGAAIVVAHQTQLTGLARIQKVLFGVAAIVALFGIFQFVSDSLGAPPSVTGLRPNYIKSIFGFPRIQSTALEPLFFANYLLLPLLLSATLLYVRLMRGLRSYSLLFLYALVLALTLSRGGIIAGIAGLTIILLLLMGHTSWVSAAKVVGTIAIAGICALGSIYAVTTLAANQKGAGDKAVKRYVKQSTAIKPNGAGNNDRARTRQLALDAFRARPLLGNGVGSFGAYAQRSDPKDYPKTSERPIANNEYYEILAETGLLGGAVLLGFILTSLMRLISAWRSRPTLNQRAWLVALAAAGIAVGIQYYSFSTLYIPHIWLLVGLFLGLTATRSSNAKAA